MQKNNTILKILINENRYNAIEQLYAEAKTFHIWTIPILKCIICTHRADLKEFHAKYTRAKLNLMQNAKMFSNKIVKNYLKHNFNLFITL